MCACIRVGVNTGMDNGYVANARSGTEVSMMRIGSQIMKVSFVCFGRRA